MSFSGPRFNPGSHCVQLSNLLSLPQSLPIMILILLKSTGQLFSRMSFKLESV